MSDSEQGQGNTSYNWGKNWKTSLPCPTCGFMASWIDYGPNVGQGFYCRICKDEVDSPDNIYGIAAQARRRELTYIGKLKTIDSPQFLNCTKVGCQMCNGAASKLPQVDIKVGDWVWCYIDKKTNHKIKYSGAYEVVALEPQGIRIQVGKERLAYSRCRFKLYKKAA